MKEKISQFLQKNFFAVVLTLITVFLSWQNWEPGTWLTGWDSLHPEFSFPLNIKRAIFGVWREEQGLGTVAAHSHMADLPRIILLYLASFVLPSSFLRYFYFFACLVLGPLGVYYFLEKIIFKNKPFFQAQLASFLGGLFYLLNLGTLQHFYVPFEMFATCFAFLPWLFLLATKFLSQGSKKDLAFFSLVTLLATPMAYAATLWYAFFICFIIYGLTFFLLKSRNLSGLKRLISILSITLVVNSYWLLPNLYFLTNSAGTISQAKINQLFSAEAFLRDKKYATLQNAALLKGFLFDWKSYNFSQRGFLYLLETWQEHLKTPHILIIGWLLFGLVSLGVLISILKKEKTVLFLPVFLFSFLFLTHGVWPISTLFLLIRESFPFFKEGLRFPWTKFSIMVMFCFSIFWAQAVFGIISFAKKRSAQILASLVLAGLLFIFMAPAFSGQLISPSKKTTLPQDYFEVFAFFEKRPAQERIGTFPIHTFWGWEYYRWGFEGAGFLWFGLKQPVLVRDFDRWNPANENFYWEASYALYSGNRELLEAVLEKYQVSWLLVDNNVASVSNYKLLYFDELEEMLSASEKIWLEKTFGKIKLYRVDLEKPAENFKLLAQNLPVIGPTYQWNNFDKAYLVHGNYISNSPFSILNSQFYYPFRSLFTGKNQEGLEFEVKDQGEYFVFKGKLPQSLKAYQLQTPKFDPKELVFIDPKNLARIRYLSPKVIYDQSLFEVYIPKVGGYLSYDNILTGDLYSQEAKNCDNFNEGTVESKMVKEDEKSLLRLAALNANNCLAFQMPNLPHELAYLISLEHRNLSGRSLRFWLENFNSRKPDLEIEMPPVAKLSTDYFIQPPMEKYGLGYAFHFDNISIGQQKTVNDLGRLTVQPFPYKFLTGIHFERKEKLPADQVLIFYQAFDKDWVAFRATNRLSKILPFFGQKINSHVLVNSWANGWVLEETKNAPIIILFWPQYLEYFGFLLLAGLLIFIVVGVVKERK